MYISPREEGAAISEQKSRPSRRHVAACVEHARDASGPRHWACRRPRSWLESRLHQPVRCSSLMNPPGHNPPGLSGAATAAATLFIPTVPSLASRPRCLARSAVITAEYAVRGELVLRAATIKQEGFKGVPFDKLLECNSN